MSASESDNLVEGTFWVSPTAMINTSRSSPWREFSVAVTLHVGFLRRFSSASASDTSLNEHRPFMLGEVVV